MDAILLLILLESAALRHCLAPPEGPGTRGTPGVNPGGPWWFQGDLSEKKKILTNERMAAADGQHRDKNSDLDTNQNK